MNRDTTGALRRAMFAVVTIALSVACGGCLAFQSQVNHPLVAKPLPGGGQVELCEFRIERALGRDETSLEIVWTKDDTQRLFTTPVPVDLDTTALKLAVEPEQHRAWVYRPGETIFSVDEAAQREWKYGQPQPAWAVPE